MHDLHDPRFAFHLAPPAGWCNDPNGVIFWRWRYHVFYQWSPDARRGTPMHWAHASSADGFTWAHHPPALIPDAPYENNSGCWSGSAVADGDRLVLIYTGHHDVGADKRRQAQCVAISDDGETFTKAPANPVLEAPPHAPANDFRDPKVWRHEDWWYMVVGSRRRDDDPAPAAAPLALMTLSEKPGPATGRVLLFRSRDLRRWEDCGVLLDGLGGVCECPDFFELDGRWVLLTSPYGSPRAVVGDFDWSTFRFTPSSVQRLDWGPDYYAPQTTIAPGGSRWSIAWLGNWAYPSPQAQHGFSWSMTLPRLLSMRDSRVIQAVDLESLRAAAGFRTTVSVNVNEPAKAPAAFELTWAALAADATVGVSLSSAHDPDGRFELQIGAEGHFVLGRTRNDRTRGRVIDRSEVHADVPLAGHPVRLLVDRWSVEAFAADGACVFTVAMDLAPGPRTVRVTGAPATILR